MKKFVTFLFIMLFCFQSTWGQEKLSFLKKDPFLAGALSFYNPGLGQFYVGDTESGMLFWVGENILFFSALLMVTDISFKLKKDFGFEFKIKQKSNLSDGKVATAIGLGIGFLFLHIYNIIHAVDAAKDYNRQLEERFLSNSNDVPFGIAIREDSAMFILRQRF
ncbi:MAG: hypothetical protein IEMM0008_0606 [bacterium]|nr:MAG: hypothetical protein IEMM0008_0606 [bacterium]